MKTLDIYNCKPMPLHVELAQKFGSGSLGDAPPEEFYADCPEAPGFERAEPGCLIRTSRCVMPHADTWLGDWHKTPRRQRSLFWVLSGSVQFKVDGFGSRLMRPGDWVVFDHRREHMVLADGKWLGAAWQLRGIYTRILTHQRPPQKPTND